MKDIGWYDIIISIICLIYAHDVILWRHQIIKYLRLSYVSDHIFFSPEIHSSWRSFWGISHPLCSETLYIYTKTYFDNASITRRDFRFRRFLQTLDFFVCGPILTIDTSEQSAWNVHFMENRFWSSDLLIPAMTSSI